MKEQKTFLPKSAQMTQLKAESNKERKLKDTSPLQTSSQSRSSKLYGNQFPLSQLDNQHNLQNKELQQQEISHNKNIETFRSRSNKYSRESMQFLHEKRVLLNQESSNLPRHPAGKQPFDLLAEVNRIYEIRTQFNKFEQENHSHSKHQSSTMENSPFFTQNDSQQRYTGLQPLISDDVDEVKENDMNSVSSRMKTLQSGQRQVFSIQKVENQNSSTTSETCNQTQQQTTNNSFQEMKSNNIIHYQQVNSYVLNPSQARTSLQSVNSQPSLHTKRFSSPPTSLNRQTPPTNDMLRVIAPIKPELNQVPIMASGISLSKRVLPDQNFLSNPISTPFLETSFHPNELRKSQDSFSTQNFGIRDSKMDFNTGLSGTAYFGGGGAGIQQSPQTLGYAVNLVNKGISDLSKHFQLLNPSTLQVLDLSSNQISTFPEEILLLKNLKVLKLENNLIRIIPQDLFSQLQLESFSISNNLITEIPDEIVNWNLCLQRLNLSKNHIKSFSKELCSLQNMTSLNVSSNDFTEIPFEMTALSQLKEFSIDWFKYCLPPRRTTVQGQEGNLIILEMFSLLRENRSQGYVTFLQFTTKFSDKELIRVSKTIKRRNFPIQAKPNYFHPQLNSENSSIVDGSNHKLGTQFKNQFRQDMKQFTLNISNGNLANSTFTSINESCLPKEIDGIQFLPQAPKTNGHLFNHDEELQSPMNGVKNSIVDSITHNSEFSGMLLPPKQLDHFSQQEQKKYETNQIKFNQNNSNLTQEQPQIEGKINLVKEDFRQNSVLLSSQQQQKINNIYGTKNMTGNNGGPQQMGSSATIPLMNFSSQTVISVGDEALKSHNDLSFFQEENYQNSHISAKIVSPQSGSQFIKNTNKSSIGIKRNELLGEKGQDCDKQMAQNALLLQQLNLDIVEPPQSLFQQHDSDIIQINNLSKDIEEHKQNITANLTNSPPIYSQYYLIDPKNGRNLLHLAVMDEDISALRCLITLNPDLINQVDFDGHTPLSLSIFEEKYFSAKILVFNQADTNLGGGGFGSCLTIGVVKLQYFLIRDLIRFGANVNKVDAEGNSPMHYLFQQFIKEPEESVKIAQLLLDNGADPNLENNAKWSPLHFGIRSGSLEALQFALGYNSVCFSKKIKRGFLLNKPGGPEGLTLLHIASELNCPKIVSLLLNNHVDIFSRQCYDKTPSQLCQRHILVKKLILLKQSQILEEFIEDQLEINDNEPKQTKETNEINKKLTKSYSFEKYNKNKIEKNFQKKGFLSSLREDTREDDFNRLSEEEEIDDQNENGDKSESCEIEDDSQNENKRNLNDSADSFPVDEEDEDHNQQSQSQSMSTLAKNNLNQIHISSQPRMIKNETHTLSVSGIQRLKDKEEILTRQETEFNEMNESKMSLEEIEDEDYKGDAPKWFYKDHSQIPYSPNNLQKIEGMNEIISQIISQSSNHNASAPNLLRYKPQSVLLTKPFPDQGKTNHLQSKIFNQKMISPLNPTQKVIKSQTMQTCNFFTNLKNYKQVLKSASNIGEFQLKILEENLALSTRLNFLVQLRLIQFKLIQVLRLITRSSIYQQFCRSGIIEDFLKLGDDNLNTLINTSKDFGNCIINIYNKLFESPNFDNNTLLAQLINLFGDSSINLLNKVENALLKQKQSMLSGSKKNEQNANKNEEKKINFFGLMILPDQKINYENNILKDYLEIEQCQKMIKDTFTKKTLITDLDFDRIMPPTEDEYEPQSEQLSKTLSNYAHIKKRSNPLQSISYESKFFK